ncbi:unnamed protein product [Euphydryas editha]|uniref:Uncharacterized protein n=1 Tax=Euphydryas editha TaxID=104508 RepID=A0AAU9TIK4_EUPED|nr:unnamed protein product [Euphydryas editha]
MSSSHSSGLSNEASRRLVRYKHTRRADWTLRLRMASALAQTTSYNLISHITASDVPCKHATLTLFIASASSMFPESRIDCFYTIIRKQLASLGARMRGASNTILSALGDRWDYPMFCRLQLHAPVASYQYL